MHVLSVLVCFSSWFFHIALCWRQWTWDTTESSPIARRGHSFVTYDSQLIVFGGRANDQIRAHVPKTYEITRVNGSLEFVSYQDKDAYATALPDVPVATYLNDLWSYDINCTRFADNGCSNSAWKLLNQGAEGGGCAFVSGASRCTHPAERWMHTAQVFRDKTMVIYGGFGPMCDDYCDDVWLYNFSNGSWTELIKLGSKQLSPGKRFKFSSIVFNDEMYIFGGFRLWQELAHENSGESADFPLGGYLNDLWVYHKHTNTWTNITEKIECPTVLPDTKVSDTEVECLVNWPPGRAGHTSVLFDKAMFIHGGYRTFFPYPTPFSAAAGLGTLESRRSDFNPTHPNYLSDMWKFNITTGLWSQVVPDRNVSPGPRVDHSLVVAKDIFLLFGGYRTNFYYADTWQYNTSANRWIQQHSFVYPIYPASCTDDLSDRQLAYSGSYAVYVPASNLSENLNGYDVAAEAHYGTNKFSVLAEPTRGSNEKSVFIPQARRQAPGWDGCRDRADKREDLPAHLQWEYPAQRSGHRSVYHEGFDKVFLFGGYGYEREEKYENSITFDATCFGDLWHYDAANCIKNCSLHGTCVAGNCHCDEGYYGEDCSNSSCPGSYCSYDDVRQTQSCTHCCFSGFKHTQNDSYVENIPMVSCSINNEHYSNGVCDGFGKCLCKPPFVGDVCSIRDCRANCSGHGSCSQAFPNSRCICDKGWHGKYCDLQLCLNNCSYPNGECVNGSCSCSKGFGLSSNTRKRFPLVIEDCSSRNSFAATLRFSSTFMSSMISSIVGLSFLLSLHVE